MGMGMGMVRIGMVRPRLGIPGTGSTNLYEGTRNSSLFVVFPFYNTTLLLILCGNATTKMQCIECRCLQNVSCKSIVVVIPVQQHYISVFLYLHLLLIHIYVLHVYLCAVSPHVVCFQGFLWNFPWSSEED